LPGRLAFKIYGSAVSGPERKGKTCRFSLASKKKKWPHL
jgi:hypothetical protein